jgi:signal peptidase I
VVTRTPAAAAVLAVTAAVVVTAGVLRWRYALVTVSGPSMEPELANGDRLLARRCGLGRLRRGDLVIFREPGRYGWRPAWLSGAARQRWVIKRVAAIPGDPVPDAVRPAVSGAAVVPPRSIVVLGTAVRSRDSRQWGFITAQDILGVSRARLG